MNKLFYIALLCFLGMNAFANVEYECEITSTPAKLDILDEYQLEVPGMTYTQDYDKYVTVERFGFLTDISIGDNFYQSPDFVKFEENETEIKVSIDEKKRDQKLLFKLYKKSKLGVIFFKEAKRFQVMVTFDCNDYSKERKLIEKEDPEMKTEVTFRELNERVLEMMLEVDLPFELGDGYYDLLEEKFYKVTSKSGEVIGYIVESELSYTEDDENAYVTDYYLANGIRFNSSHW